MRRDLVVIACAVSAGVHAALVPSHLAEATATGLGFVAAAVALAAVVVALTRRPASVAALAAAAIVLAGLLAAYALAVSTGQPLDALAVGTKAIEAAGLLAAASLLVRGRAVAVIPVPAPLALTTLIALFSALAALMVSGSHDAHGHHHG